MHLPILSGIKRVIDEVGKDRLYALLAHHEPPQFYKTLKLHIFGRSVRLCARCTGIYLGVITTILLFMVSINIPDAFQSFVLFLFPFPAVVDWSLSKYGLWKGTNSTRIVSGFMLGINYTFLWSRFIQNPLDIVIWQVAIIYSVVVGVIIISKRKTIF